MADIQIPPGLLVVTTYGQITQQTAQCLMELRSFSEGQGLKNVKYTMIPGVLVEKARNEAVRMMLKEGFGWIVMIDGDMTFDPNSLVAPEGQRAGLLQVAFGEQPNLDVLGAYCPLRGEMAIPTIDSGTGTWESHYPHSGIIPVMRTGGAFLLAKRRVFEGMQDPWFRMRVPARPLDFMAEVDNFARIKFNGANPFRDKDGQYWEKLEQCAKEDPSGAQFTPVEVGEDSGFCDRAKMAGFQLAVHTGVVCGHVEQRVTTWVDHKKAMDSLELNHRYAVGLLA